MKIYLENYYTQQDDEIPYPYFLQPWYALITTFKYKFQENKS